MLSKMNKIKLLAIIFVFGFCYCKTNSSGNKISDSGTVMDQKIQVAPNEALIVDCNNIGSLNIKNAANDRIKGIL